MFPPPLCPLVNKYRWAGMGGYFRKLRILSFIQTGFPTKYDKQLKACTENLDQMVDPGTLKKLPIPNSMANIYVARKFHFLSFQVPLCLKYTRRLIFTYNANGVNILQK